MANLHYMRPNEGNRLATQIVCVDTETNRIPLRQDGRLERHELRLGVARFCRIEGGVATRQQQLDFERATTFWQWLAGRLSSRRATWLWGHNLGYDLSILRFWDLLAAKEFYIDQDAGGIPPVTSEGKRRKAWRGFVCLSDPPTIVVCRHRTGGTLVCVDLFNWLRCPLKDIGNTIGLPKLEMPDNLDNTESLWEYCERDCQIVEKAVLSIMAFVRDNDLGNVRWTAAGQSMASWRHWHKGPWPLPDPGHPARKLDREAYYGGQVLCLRWGKVEGVVYHLDCSSFYPSLMRQHTYPFRLHWHRQAVPVDDLEKAARSLGLVARVRIETDHIAFPVPTDVGVCHCTGRFWTTLAGPELEIALRHGLVTECSEAAAYLCGDLFSEWVDRLWLLRRKFQSEGMEVWAKLIKLLLNSLGGKFAQKSSDWRRVEGRLAEIPWGQWSAVDAATGKSVSLRSLAWTLEVEGEKGEREGTFPAVSAFLTSYGRVRMARLRAVAGEGNVYYQDTDSLHTNEQGYLNLCAAGQVASDRIGSLRLVEVVQGAEYVGWRHYRLGDKWVIAGVKKSAKRVSDGGFEQDEWDRLPRIVLGDLSHTVRVQVVRKEVGRYHLGGEPLADGTVVPYRLGGR